MLPEETRRAVVTEDLANPAHRGTDDVRYPDARDPEARRPDGLEPDPHLPDAQDTSDTAVDVDRRDAELHDTGQREGARHDASGYDQADADSYDTGRDADPRDDSRDADLRDDSGDAELRDDDMRDAAVKEAADRDDPRHAATDTSPGWDTHRGSGSEGLDEHAAALASSPGTSGYPGTGSAPEGYPGTGSAPEGYVGTGSVATGYPGTGEAPASPSGAVSSTTGGSDDLSEPLFDSGAAEQFRTRWRELQVAFVDEPRSAVQRADELVAEVLQSLATTFATHKRELDSQWQDDGQAETEQLRLALREYRSFFDQLLRA